MNRFRQSCAGACLFAMLCAVSPPVLAEQIIPVFQHELPDIAGKTFSVVEVDFAAGTQVEAHRHGQAFVYAYVSLRDRAKPAGWRAGADLWGGTRLV